MKLVFLPEAAERITAVDAWWRAHRPEAADLFGREIDETLARLAATPLPLGTVHRVVRGIEIRRVLSSKTRQFLYYAVHPDDDAIVLHSVWGAQRRRGPAL